MALLVLLIAHLAFSFYAVGGQALSNTGICKTAHILNGYLKNRCVLVQESGETELPLTCLSPLLKPWLEQDLRQSLNS